MDEVIPCFSCLVDLSCTSPGKIIQDRLDPSLLVLSNMFSCPIFSPSPFVCSPKRLSFESSFTRTLHDSLLQGHILPSRGPRHPRPAPLVSQVVLSSYVIDRGESFGVLDIIGDSFFVFTSSLPPFLASFLLPFYFLRNSFPFRNRSYTSHRALSLCLPPSSPSLLSFREQLLLRITFLKITAPSLCSSPQEATVQRALRQ